MNIFALVLALVALILFAIDYSRGKSLVSLGLAFLTGAWILQLTLVDIDLVTIG